MQKKMTCNYSHEESTTYFELCLCKNVHLLQPPRKRELKSPFWGQVFLFLPIRSMMPKSPT